MYNGIVFFKNVYNVRIIKTSNFMPFLKLYLPGLGSDKNSPAVLGYWTVLPGKRSYPDQSKTSPSGTRGSAALAAEV